MRTGEGPKVPSQVKVSLRWNFIQAEVGSLWKLGNERVTCPHRGKEETRLEALRTALMALGSHTGWGQSVAGGQL